MNRFRLLHRAADAVRRRTARWFERRTFTMLPGQAMISFTFDDFPRSALETGGAIMEEHGVVGTYYVSLGLADRASSPCGSLFTISDLGRALSLGHELGCHTYAHCPAWTTPATAFIDSVRRNADELRRHVPNASFRTLSYPISYPRPATKHLVGRRFCCCRGGGQNFNAGTIDLNYLSAFFLEQSANDLEAVKRMVMANQAKGGWLIFATHDVAQRPTRFGCSPKFFRQVIRFVREIGAEVLPVGRAFDVLRARISSPA